MAVMYSKLGGCLGVTTKLGPLAKTDLRAGVKGLLERFMTHLGLGSSLEEPWGSLLGGEGGVAFLGGSVNLTYPISGIGYYSILMVLVLNNSVTVLLAL